MSSDKHDNYYYMYDFQLPKFTSTSPTSLSALVDCTAEQKTISDLRYKTDFFIIIDYNQ